MSRSSTSLFASASLRGEGNVEPEEEIMPTSDSVPDPDHIIVNQDAAPTNEESTSPPLQPPPPLAPPQAWISSSTARTCRRPSNGSILPVEIGAANDYYPTGSEEEEDHQTVVSEVTLASNTSLFRGSLYPSVREEVIPEVAEAAQQPQPMNDTTTEYSNKKSENNDKEEEKGSSNSKLEALSVPSVPVKSSKSAQNLEAGMMKNEKNMVNSIKSAPATAVMMPGTTASSDGGSVATSQVPVAARGITEKECNFKMGVAAIPTTTTTATSAMKGIDAAAAAAAAATIATSSKLAPRTMMEEEEEKEEEVEQLDQSSSANGGSPIGLSASFVDAMQDIEPLPATQMSRGNTRINAPFTPGAHAVAGPAFGTSRSGGESASSAAAYGNHSSATRLVRGTLTTLFGNNNVGGGTASGGRPQQEVQESHLQHQDQGCISAELVIDHYHHDIDNCCRDEENTQYHGLDRSNSATTLSIMDGSSNFIDFSNRQENDDAEVVMGKVMVEKEQIKNKQQTRFFVVDRGWLLVIACVLVVLVLVCLVPVFVGNSSSRQGTGGASTTATTNNATTFSTGTTASTSFNDNVTFITNSQETEQQPNPLLLLEPFDIDLPEIARRDIQQGDIDSPFYKANKWILSDPNYDVYSKERKWQRFYLVMLYHATHGDSSWIDNTNWLSYKVSECYWFSQSSFSVDSIYYEPNVCRDNDTGGALINLSLANNNLTGSLPLWYSSFLPELRIIDLGHNSIGGPLPAVTTTSIVEVMILANNPFVGMVSISGGGIFDNIKVLRVDGTLFSVHGGKTAYIMPNLEVLNSTNKPNEVEIYSSWYGLPHLRYVGWGHKPDTFGSIPTEVGLATSLIEIDYSSLPNLAGSIPSEMGLLTHLAKLDISGTPVTGTVPSQMCQRIKEGLLELLADCAGGSLQCCKS